MEASGLQPRKAVACGRCCLETRMWVLHDVYVSHFAPSRSGFFVFLFMAIKNMATRHGTSFASGERCRVVASSRRRDVASPRRRVVASSRRRAFAPSCRLVFVRHVVAASFRRVVASSRRRAVASSRHRVVATTRSRVVAFSRRRAVAPSRCGVVEVLPSPAGALLHTRLLQSTDACAMALTTSTRCA